MTGTDRIAWVGILVGVLLPTCALADEWIAFSTAKARAVALGGAYFSAEDELFSAQWNPAAFGDPRYLRERWVRAYLMPTTPLLAFYRFRSRSLRWRHDEGITGAEAIVGTFWAVKGLSFAWHTWTLGFVNADEPLRPRPEAEPAWPGWNGITGQSYTLAFAFKLAPQVAFGASATHELRTAEATTRRWGGTFGVILRPSSKVNVGLTYVSRPDNLLDLDEELERVDRGTINGGISLYPWPGTACFADLRNLDESETRFGFAELHLGVEQMLFGLAAVRAGWYRIDEDGTVVYSAGIGIKPFWREADEARPGRQTDLFAYTFVWQHNVEWDRRWHLLALTIPLEW